MCEDPTFRNEIIDAIVYVMQKNSIFRDDVLKEFEKINILQRKHKKVNIIDLNLKNAIQEKLPRNNLL